MLIRMNINVVFEIGKSDPNLMILVSAKVSRPTRATMTTIRMISRFRFLRSFCEREDVLFFGLLAFIRFRSVDEIDSIPIGFKIPERNKE